MVPLQCKFCQKYISNQSNLTKHIKNLHQSDLQYAKENFFVPAEETTNTKTPEKQNENQEEDISNFQYRCDSCSKNFTWKKTLVAHTKKLNRKVKICIVSTTS